MSAFGTSSEKFGLNQTSAPRPRATCSNRFSLQLGWVSSYFGGERAGRAQLVALLWLNLNIQMLAHYISFKRLLIRSRVVIFYGSVKPDTQLF